MDLRKKEYFKILEQFINNGRSDIDRLQSAIKRGNTVEAADAAHSLKGGAIIVGLTGIYEIAAEIEEKSRNGQLAEAAAAAQNLMGAFAGACASIE